jgi:hypothetical protein
MASGTASKPNPTPKPNPDTPAETRRSTYNRWSSSSLLSDIPVVNNSSPPDNHGVGSESSEMCAQVISLSSPRAPATTVSLNPGNCRSSDTAGLTMLQSVQTPPRYHACSHLLDQLLLL